MGDGEELVKVPQPNWQGTKDDLHEPDFKEYLCSHQRTGNRTVPLGLFSKSLELLERDARDACFAFECNRGNCVAAFFFFQGNLACSINPFRNVASR